MKTVIGTNRYSLDVDHTCKYDRGAYYSTESIVYGSKPQVNLKFQISGFYAYLKIPRLKI